MEKTPFKTAWQNITPRNKFNERYTTLAHREKRTDIK